MLHEHKAWMHEVENRVEQTIKMVCNGTMP